MAPATEPLVVGRYELHDELASGGMATVYLGRSHGSAGFSRSVAIKRLHPPLARDPDFVTLLLEEARLAERIRHANVVPVLDVVAAGSELLLVMEYVHGETLGRLLRACAQARVKCPRDIAASIAHGVLLGLHASHQTTDASGAPLCIVHRDVSPQNILVGADGVARLLDFGIAKASGSANVTREGKVKGKVPYMAPEILELAPASVQSDIYAVGVTLWEALCARRLFRADTEIGLWSQVLAAQIPKPSTLLGPLGPLEDVVMRALARAPGDRYPDALAMAEALAASTSLASSAEVAAWVADRASDALAQRSALVVAMESRDGVVAAPPAARRRRPWATRAIVVLLAFTVGGLVALRQLEAQRARPPLPVVVASFPPPILPDPAPAVAPTTPAVVAAASAAPAPLPRRRAASAAPAAPVAATSVPQNPCDPPYSLDATGRKHFKLECVK